VGKSTIARELARRIGAVHVRIDSIEQALRDAGQTVEDAGYRAAYAVAEDNLRLGHDVIADCVNPWPLTRAAWRAVADRAGVSSLEIEIVCSDPAEHRRRVEIRTMDVAGLRLPSWQDVIARDYRSWDGDRLVIDTARSSVDESVAAICAAIEKRT
jgi:predicted kinase